MLLRQGLCHNLASHEASKHVSGLPQGMERLSQNHKSEKAVSRKALKPKYSLFDTIEETEVLRQPQPGELTATAEAVPPYRRTKKKNTRHLANLLFICPYVLLFIFRHKDKKVIRTQDFYFLCPYGLIFV